MYCLLFSMLLPCETEGVSSTTAPQQPRYKMSLEHEQKWPARLSSFRKRKTKYRFIEYTG